MTGPEAIRSREAVSGPTDALDFALHYLQRGFSLVPLHGKKPNVPALRRLRKTGSWKALVNHPMTTADVADIFGQRYPAGGIGILTGAPSGVVVADIDDLALAPDGLADWPTLTALTPDGGRHKYFAADLPVAAARFPWGEVKSDGGYVAAPGGRPGRTWLDPDAMLAPYAEVACLLVALSSTTRKGHSSSRGRKGSDTGTASLLSDAVERLERDPELLARFAPLFGRQPVTDRNVACLLHPPDHEPSARFTVAEDGAYLHHCFHDGSSYKLGTVYALVIGSIEPGAMSSMAALIWQARMLADLGLLAVPEIPFAPAPASVPPAYRDVYEKVRLLFALRSMTRVGMEAPLTPHFLASWCGIPVALADAARDHLYATGLIRRVAKCGRTIIWAPALVHDGEGIAA